MHYLLIQMAIIIQVSGVGCHLKSKLTRLGSPAPTHQSHVAECWHVLSGPEHMPARQSRLPGVLAAATDQLQVYDEYWLVGRHALTSGFFFEHKTIRSIELLHVVHEENRKDAAAELFSNDLQPSILEQLFNSFVIVITLLVCWLLFLQQELLFLSYDCIEEVRKRIWWLQVLLDHFSDLAASANEHSHEPVG